MTGRTRQLFLWTLIAARSAANAGGPAAEPAADTTAGPSPASRPGDANVAPAPSAGEQDWNWHAQGTFIGDLHPALSAGRPAGPNSLSTSFERQETLSLDLTAAARLWRGAEFHVDGLLWQGFGFSKTLGAEGFPNAEAYRLGTQYPNVTFARVLVRQVIGLGGGKEPVADDALHLAGSADVSRVTLTAGKMSVLDIFDNNTYAGSARTQFQNWGLTSDEAWDYPADSIGYMTGFAADWHEKNWSLRYGFFQLPKVSNGVAVDQSYLKAWGMVTELERRFSIADRPGAVRVLGFLNRARMGSYQEALNHPPATIAETREYRSKYGFGVNAEQEILHGVGVFARLGWSDGHTESWAFADVDRSASFGVSVRGESWSRPNDTLAAAGLFNDITSVHQRFLEAGGTGILAGDGYLDHGVEEIMEVYYDATLWNSLHGALDYQFIANPAYNRDRGPIHVLGLRLHWEY